MKMIRTLELKAEAKTIPENIADYCIDNDTDPDVISENELSYYSLTEAKRWLSTKTNTARKMDGNLGSYYLLRAYCIEHYEADEDGEFIEGSNFDSAEDEKKYYTADREAGNFIDCFDTYQDAVDAIKEYEATDKADGTYTPDFYEVEYRDHSQAENPIKEIRNITGLSQAKFGKQYNIPIRTIQDWEAEVRKPPEYVVGLLERVVKEDYR